MAVNYIGPLNVTPAHLVDNNTYADGSENFTLLTDHPTAKQLQGFQSKTSRTDYGDLSIISPSKHGWGVMPIDTSTPLVDNNDWTHRGYYIVNTVEPEIKQGAYMQSKVSAEKVGNLTDYLTMDYTRGVNDGTQIEHSYDDSTTDYYLWDEFDTFNWTTLPTYASYSGNYLGAVSGGKLYSTMRSTAGNSWSSHGATINTQLPSKFIAEFTMEYTAVSADYVVYYSVVFLPYLPNSVNGSNAYIPYAGPVYANGWAPAAPNFLAIEIYTSVSNGYLYVRRRVNGANVTTPAGWTIGTTNKIVTLRLIWYGDGTVAVYKSSDGGTTWSVFLSRQNLGLNFTQPWVAVCQGSRSATAKAFYTDYFHIYDTEDVSRNNVVAVPSTDFTLKKTPNFTRVGEYNFGCYNNLQGEDLPFKTATPSSFYKGAVMGYNSNYTGSVERIITGNRDEVLSPSKFKVKNGLVQIQTNNSTTTPVVVSAYYSGAYNSLATMGFGGVAIDTIKPLHISPEKHTYQINDTRWTMWRGKPFIKITHPNTNVYFTRKTYYDSDGSTWTPGADNVDIPMNSTYYCNAYNAGETYRMQILQTQPTSIKSNYIPSSEMSGVGYIDNGKSSGDPQHYINVAREFMTQPQQNIGVKPP